MREIEDSLFVTEMQILWQNLKQNKRNDFANLIRDYYSEGDRAEKIINRMQVGL